ncbi:MAG: single-stranded DNA-binding protein [Lentisphaerae bacterium]|mgnify:FL=1|nr:single-stranded DNA-binding protein [Lentisphaerota bacterium]
MASLNKVILMGNLTKDPELRKLPSGTAVCDLRLAVNEDYTNRDGQKVEKTLFVDVATWERQAENCEKYLKKGSPVLVEGKLELDEWQTEQGEKRSRMRVRAINVQFLSRRESDESGAPGQSAARAPAPARDNPPPDDKATPF